MVHDDAISRPLREPLWTTLARTGMMALVVGAVMTRWLGGLGHLPTGFLLGLWPSFGGHWVELGFLNWVRFRIPAARVPQVGVRVVVWFVGGIALTFGMRLTAMAVGAARFAHWPAWWVGGLAFVGIELIVHLALRLRGRPGFYDARGPE